MRARERTAVRQFSKQTQRWRSVGFGGMSVHPTNIRFITNSESISVTSLPISPRSAA